MQKVCPSHVAMLVCYYLLANNEKENPRKSNQPRRITLVGFWKKNSEKLIFSDGFLGQKGYAQNIATTLFL
jgi:hypothetical protein